MSGLRKYLIICHDVLPGYDADLCVMPCYARSVGVGGSSVGVHGRYRDPN
jgi:hypothetical protein